MKRVDYLYILFKEPGPPSMQHQSEVQALVQHVGRSHPESDFSQVKVRAVTGPIGEIDDYEEVTMGIMAWLMDVSPGTAANYDIQRQAIWADGNPHFDRVHVAWAEM